MTRTSEPATEHSSAAPATDAICPYLVAADGGWRASTPAREHRCTAVFPPAVLAPDKQRRLCLETVHTSCSTYRVASGAGDAPDDALPRAPVRRATRTIARTAPVVLDHGRMSISIPGLRAERGAGQLALVALMGLAFIAILFARVPGGAADEPGPGRLTGGAVATPTASPVAPGPASVTPATPLPESPVRTLVPTEVGPSAAPQATPEPSEADGPATYKVKRGDTLSGIAATYGTTWQVLAALNDIDDPGRLKVGQVLELP
jgi:hypothetical protein